MGILTESLIYIAAAVVAVPLSRRLGFGSVLGYLTAGIVIGPAALGLIDDVDHVLHFAELGVVFLLFIIGLELKPSRLWVLRRQVFGFGTAQVTVSALAIGAMALAAGLGGRAAFVVGFGLALSSTAFVLQLLAEQNQLSTAYGRSSFAILLFQDIAVIPLIAIIPLLATGSDLDVDPRRITFTIAILAALILGGRYLLRPVLRIVAQSGIQELFTAVTLLVVLGAATIMQAGGLSMGLGAFIAGMLLADSEYRHELESNIEPFKGLLLGLFFIAVGMSVNVGLIVTRPGDVVGLTVLLIATKAAVLWALARAFGLASAARRNIAIVLSQGGEFAFVLFTIARQHGVLDPATVELLVVVVTLSMAATPVLFVANAAALRRAENNVPAKEFDTVEEENNPVVIASFGRFGQIVGRILASRGIPFTALESNAEQVEVVRRYGNKVYYGDAARIDLLRAAGIAKAKLFVLAIDDIEASVKTARTVRHYYPKLPILARARNRFHAHLLMDVGVDTIYRDTFYSGLEMTREVLKNLDIDADEANHIVDAFCRADEKMLRRQHAVRQDESKMIQTAQDATRELESLLKSDQRRRERER